MQDDKKTKDKDELGKSSVKKDDKKLSSAVSNKKVRELAEAYMKKKGMTMLHPKLTFDVSPDRGAKIAKAYEEMKHEPESPKVKKAYDALIRETLDQWNEIRKTGLKATKITPDMENPYPGGSKDVIKDIAENNHLFYFPTEQGYGSTDQQASDHPMLQKVKVDGEEVPANDVFRIVHDYFGHVKEGHGFGPQGEENAWMTHKQMYSPEAQKALTSETRGQNSWVNFGPLGEQNRKDPSKTTYAEQKAGLMPDWVVDEEPTTGREKMAGGGGVQPITGYAFDDTPEAEEARRKKREEWNRQWLESQKPQTDFPKEYDPEGKTPPLVPGKHLVHLSRNKKAFSELDPQFQGEGAKGLERERSSRIPRTYYYEVQKSGGYNPEGVVVRDAKHQYIINRPDKIIDLASKQGKLLAEQSTSINDLEKNIYDLGFAGYKNSDHPELSHAVALFHKQKPIHIKKYADGGRVMMQGGGDPANVMPETTPMPEPMAAPAPAPEMVTPNVTPMPDLEEAPTETLTPEIKRTHVPMWHIGGAKPELTEVSHEMVQEGVRNGVYSFDKNTKVPVIAPDDNQLYYIPAVEAQDAFNQGYQYADPKTINEVKYGGAGQTALAVGEAALRGLVSSPVASAIEVGLGADKEAILGREEAHSGLAKTTEALTFAAPLLLTGGAWAAGKAGLGAAAKGLGAAAEVAAKAPLSAALTKAGSFIPEGAKWYSKIGFGTGRAAFEGALFQASDELGKAYLDDPEQTAGSIMASLGLGTLIGGGLGFGFGAAGQAYKGVKGLFQKGLDKISGGAYKASIPASEPITGKVLKTGVESEPLTGKPPTVEPAPQKNPDDYIEVQPEDVPNYDTGDLATHIKYDDQIPESVKPSLMEIIRDPSPDAGHTLYLWNKIVAPKYPNAKIPGSLLSRNSFLHNTEQAIGEKYTGQTVANNMRMTQNAIHDSVVEITGSGEPMSRVAVGEDMMENLLAQQRAQDKIHAEVFDAIREQTDTMPLDKKIVAQTVEQMKGIFKNLETSDPDTLNFLNSTIRDLNLKSSVTKLKDFATKVYQRADGAPNKAVRDFGYDLARVIRELESKSIDQFAMLPNISPEVRAVFEGLNAQRKTINEVFANNSEKYSRLAKILKAKAPQSFADYERVFSDLSPEKITKALETASFSDKMWFRKAFPKEFEKLRKHEINRIVQSAKFSRDTDPRATKILDKIVGGKDTSIDPKLVDLWFTPDEINALKEIYELNAAIPYNINPSGTGARMHMHEFLAGLVNPKFLAAQLVKAGAEHAFLKAATPKDIVPVSKKSLRFKKNFAEGGIVSNDFLMPQMEIPQSPKTAFARAVLQPPEIQQAQQLAQAAIRGEKLIKNSVKSVFDPRSAYKIPSPAPKNVEKVKEYINQAQENPSVLLNAGHPDFPEMSGTFARSASSAAGYISSLQPPPPKDLPFDTGVKMPPSTHQDIYNHVLKVTEQPLYILQKVKQGTVIPEEVGAVRTIYPALYQKLQNQITEHLIEAKTKGATIPYRTKIGLSAFLGSPIDTTMTPEAIQATQPMQQNQPPQGAQTGAQPKRSTSALDKMATMAQTPGQARTAERSSGK